MTPSLRACLVLACVATQLFNSNAAHLVRRISSDGTVEPDFEKPEAHLVERVVVVSSDGSLRPDTASSGNSSALPEDSPNASTDSQVGEAGDDDVHAALKEADLIEDDGDAKMTGSLNGKSRRRRRSRRRAPSGTFPQPSSTYLKCDSPHHRKDRHPLISSDGSQADKEIKEVESHMIGHGLWKRYDVGSIPDHALIQNLQTLTDVLTKAAGNEPSLNSDVKISQLTSASDRKAIVAAKGRIDALGGMGNLKHDVYVGVPVGEDGTQVFSPGLNQLWVTFNTHRTEVLFLVVVGADAANAPQAVYVGTKLGHHHAATIAFQFTDFSSPKNPMRYKVDVSKATGLPRLEMSLDHAEKNDPYETVSFDCAPADSSYVGDWMVTQKWYHLVDQEWLRAKKLLVTKIVQVYDICHCYHYSNTDLLNCLMSDSKSQWWKKLVANLLPSLRHSSIVKWVLDIDGKNWVTRPKILYKDGSTKTCWEHYKQNSLLKFASATNEVQSNKRSRLAGGMLSTDPGHEVTGTTVTASAEFYKGTGSLVPSTSPLESKQLG